MQFCVFGLPRSGTNYTEHLLLLNGWRQAERTARTRHRGPFWKHGRANECAHAIPEGCRSILVVKHLPSWLASIARKGWDMGRFYPGAACLPALWRSYNEEWAPVVSEIVQYESLLDHDAVCRFVGVPDPVIPTERF